MKTLYIIASPRAERSKSIELGNHAVAKLGGDVVTLDLHKEGVPFLTEQVIAYMYGFAKYEDLSAEDKRVADAQRKFVDQLMSADNLVIAVPMWNFGMPAILKAWFDLVIKVRETIMIENGNYTGLVKNIKKAIVITTSGGKYAGTPMAGYDSLTAPINGLLQFIGIAPKSFALEGTNIPTADIPAEIARVEADIDAYIAA